MIVYLFKNVLKIINIKYFMSIKKMLNNNFAKPKMCICIVFDNLIKSVFEKNLCHRIRIRIRNQITKKGTQIPEF